MKKPTKPQPQPAPREPQKPFQAAKPGLPLRKPTPAQATPASPPPPGSSPQELINYLAGQVQALATRLEALRAQGAGQTTEFRQLEQMLGRVQDQLVMAQARFGK